MPDSSSAPAPQVPFVGLDRQHDALSHDLRAAFERLLGSSAFTLGAEVDAFEREFADYCGTEATVGVASGTAALMLALTAAGIGPGDEVILPAHTFIASAFGVIHAGATPVFCDVDAGTGLIDPDSAAAQMSESTAAIIAVHLYGQMCDMGRLRALAQRHQLFLLEDAAQAHGATWNGARAGSVGDAASFSFYPSKNLGALGDGGAVTTNDEALATRIRELRHLGQRSKGEHVVVGYNERLDGLQASFLRAKLPHLDRWNADRRALAAMYADRLDGAVQTLTETAETPCIYHLYPVRVEDRGFVVGALADRGIQTGIHYSPTVPGHPALADLIEARGRSETPRADGWAEEVLTLPMFAELEEHEVRRVAHALLEVLRDPE